MKQFQQKRGENLIKRQLKEAYKILFHKTPLGEVNCGEICGALCCKGDCKGMWLYPSEDKLFAEKQGFEVKNTEANHGYPMLLCSGECRRGERPLACRFFPLFPLVTESGGRVKISVIRDPRAGECPLSDERVRLSAPFERAVKRAARVLVHDRETLEYMKNVSSELIEITELRDRLGK